MNETSGCTAVTLLMTKDNKIFCANAGDSRCVLSSAGVAVPLSFDHKPTNEPENARITAAGGYVQFGRVNGWGFSSFLVPGLLFIFFLSTAQATLPFPEPSVILISNATLTFPLSSRPSHVSAYPE